MKILGTVVITGCILAIVITVWKPKKENLSHENSEIEKVDDGKKAEERLIEYMNYIPEKKYDAMYAILAPESVAGMEKEAFIERNSKIYEGIGLQNMQIQVKESLTNQDGTLSVRYQTSFETVAGEISFENQANFTKGKEGLKLVWNDNLIFPELEAGDKVKVATTNAARGKILDRNGSVLAGEGTASSVGIVPGKLVDREESIEKIATLLEMKSETIEKMLEVKWIKEDSFVPIDTIPKVDELELLRVDAEEKVLKEKERQDELLSISGVMIVDVEVRQYSLGEAASHLIGYVQSVTAEDLEKHAGEGYNSNSVIGRSGMEGLYEKELKGKDGYKIYIVDENGKEKTKLASILKQDGETIKLTIDRELQLALYEEYKEEESCSVAMNPYTGEVLALVSTPSYDNNDFILGMSNQQWTLLNEDEKKPFYNRFRQTWCPGSTFKPITAAIGLKNGTIDAKKDYGEEGLSWQKDSSWGGYYVTTLHKYKPAVLENALIYSDNIYFAKAALEIGEQGFGEALNQLGFRGKLPFEITMTESQYSNTETIESEVQLADSGYGQGQVLVNPLHLASLYTSFINDGNVITPSLLYKENPIGDVWIAQAFTSADSKTVLEGLKKVVNDPNGTAYKAHREDILLAGKTGTAEIKSSKEDKKGTELGWFAVFTAEPEVENPILVVSMVEDVKERGGSGYVVEKTKKVLEKYFKE